jgi:5-methylcytosine-specific restriction enzyme subunit McrC
MHALCRFFLEQSGPGHRHGDRTMLPFLIDMARLYEQFVAEWLRTNLPSQVTIKTQEAIAIDRVQAIMDVVLYKADTQLPYCVLDTKYKLADKPANQDIYQVVAYAKAKRCYEAVLVYPAPLPQPLDIMWDDIRVRSLTFSISENLEEAGQLFLRSLNLGEA